MSRFVDISVDEQGLQYRFVHQTSDGERALLAATLEALAVVVVPVAADLVLQGYDRASEEAVAIAHPNWALIERARADDPRYRDESRQIVTVDFMSPEAVRDALESAFAANPHPDSTIVSWEWLHVYSTSARLPADLHDVELVLRLGTNEASAEIQRRGHECWVHAFRSAPDPMSIMIARSFSTTLTITVHWDIWKPGGLGGSDLELAFERLRAIGWRCVPSQP